MNRVIFDWNGTLLADSLVCWRATNKTLEMLGKKPVALARYREVWAVPIMKMYQALGCSEAEMTDEIVSAWFTCYRKGAAKARLRRGARAALEALGRMGCARVVLSNYVVGEIEGHMTRLGIRNSFDGILANENAHTPMKKGKAGRLDAYLEKAGKMQGMIVGDTEEEIKIGRAAGLMTVAITHGVCSTARLAAAKPDAMIRSLAELPALAVASFKSREAA
jgi:phosphoglycolate phosphatase